jgi:hypothetical protein
MFATNISSKCALMRSLKRPIARSVGITKPRTGPRRPPLRWIASITFWRSFAISASACLGSTPACFQRLITESRIESPARESISSRAASKAKSSTSRISRSERVGTTAARYLTPKPVWRASSRET